jgi:hypothetical protein
MLGTVLNNLRGAVCALGLLTCATGLPVHAATIYQSATYTGNDTGAYTVQAGAYFGAAFSLSQQTQITGIGGEFGGFPDGTIFGAIVSLASLSSFPTASPDNLASIALGNTVFSVPQATAVDVTAPLSLLLGPGTYAVIFGSGQFGANGSAGLGDLNSPVGSSHLFSSVFDPSWSSLNDPGVRVFVEGIETPLPAALPLMATGLAFLGFGAYRRRKRA